MPGRPPSPLMLTNTADDVSMLIGAHPDYPHLVVFSPLSTNFDHTHDLVAVRKLRDWCSKILGD